MKRERTKCAPVETTHMLLDAELPARGGALLRLQVRMDSTPRGGGEDSHLRIHLQTRFGNATPPIDRTAPAESLSHADGHAVGQRARLPARRVAALVQRGLDNPLVRRVAAPLLRHDFDTWVDLRASTAPLLHGAGALMPRQIDKLRQIGVQVPAGDAPLARSWSGTTAGSRRGFAQFSILRFDKRHLPAAVAALLGKRPFQMVAAIAQVVEEHRDPRESDAV